MQLIPTTIPDVVIIEPKVFGDDRGFFMETYNDAAFKKLGIDIDWVQDNHSRSSAGVLRGLHYQLGQPQDKLVRVTFGSVFDVAVDIRCGSPTFGKWVGVELSAENKRMLLVPKGFAHGFLVTSPTADFLYKCSDLYAPFEERGVIWNDPSIGIEWPKIAGTPQLSGKDAINPLLKNIIEDQLPTYDGPYLWAQPLKTDA
jgi:dTDP-4-dehydrorhamnose 3,5-epimerase